MRTTGTQFAEANPGLKKTGSFDCAKIWGRKITGILPSIITNTGISIKVGLVEGAMIRVRIESRLKRSSLSGEFEEG